LTVYSKGVARTAISMNPHLTDGEKQKLLASLRDDYSSKVFTALAPGVLDGAVAQMFVNDPVMGKQAQDLLVMPEGPEKRRLLREMRKTLHKQHRQLTQGKSFNERQQRRGEKLKAAIAEIIEWRKQPIVLQRPDGSMLQKLRASFFEDEAFCIAAINEDHEAMFEQFDEGWRAASVFVVEHDWAGAFANATDFDGGDFPLPAPICVFEFRISGHAVVVTAFREEEDTSAGLCMLMTIRSRHGWIINGTVHQTPSGSYAAWKGKTSVSADFSGGTLNPLPDDDVALPVIRFVAGQIRAISIALDAEVAQANVVRAPHRSNQPPRLRKPLPDYSYHVLSLARRSKAERAEVDPNAPAGTRKRLHFRRGHWRHYQESKTWINWCLVGDPDLGFVDKHYKL
jgi:hypothetical protein